MAIDKEGSFGLTVAERLCNVILVHVWSIVEGKCELLRLAAGL